MTYRFFFWDFDGTLYDTYDRITRASGKALRDLGVETPFGPLRGAIKRAVVNGWYQFAQGTDTTLEQYMARYHAHAEEEGPASIIPYPDMPETLKRVVQAGGKNFLYTHRGASGWQALNRDGLIRLFSGGVTSLDRFPLKPAPDALRFLADKFGLEKSQCVMVGDRPIDIEAGQSAGMAGVMFDPEEIFPDCPADYRFRTMKDLADSLIGE